MICPKCKKEGARYVEKVQRDSSVHKNSMPRTNFEAIHNCGFEGDII